ncbi:MAG: hypothetical protein WC828_09265 [Thermoleophilia bacterium]|jgi:hypothetical protein
MQLGDLKTSAEIAESVIKSVALVVAGLWAYRRFIVEGEHEESLCLTIGTKVLPSDRADVRLVEVRCDLRNVGKIPCQVELESSTVSVSRVGGDIKDGNVVWQANPYFHARFGTNGDLFNIPVGAAMSRVTFVAVPHPGVYGVRVIIAQTEQAARLFYRRMKLPFPADWKANPSGWDDSVIISTGGAEPEKLKAQTVLGDTIGAQA